MHLASSQEDQSTTRTLAVFEQLRLIPGAASGAVGLALCLCSLEAHRFPVVQQVSGEASTLSTTVAVLMLVALSLYYHFGRTKVLRKPPVIVAIASAGTLCLYAYYVLGGTEGETPALAKMALVLFSAISVTLAVAWMENLYGKKPVAAACLFIAALPLVFCFQSLVGLLTASVAKGTSALFPLMSAVFLMLFRKSERFSLPRSGRTGGDLSERSGKTPAQTRKALALVGVAVFCFGVFFSKMHAGWLPSQSSWGPMSIQIASASGALIAGGILTLVAPLPGKRNGVLVCEFLILVFALFSIYLSTFSSSHFSILYLAPLNTSQKIMLYLLFYACLSVPRTSTRMTAFCILFASFRAGYPLFHAATGATEPAWGPFLGDALFIVALAVAIGLLVVVMAVPTLLPAQQSSSSEKASEDNGEDPIPYKEIAFYFLFGQKYNLTQREIEVLPFLAAGRNAKAIADELYVSQATAKTHLRNIYAKLDVHTQKDLVDFVERERQSLLEQLPTWYVNR